MILYGYKINIESLCSINENSMFFIHFPPVRINSQNCIKKALTVQVAVKAHFAQHHTVFKYKCTRYRIPSVHKFSQYKSVQFRYTNTHSYFELCVLQYQKYVEFQVLLSFNVSHSVKIFFLPKSRYEFLKNVIFVIFVSGQQIFFCFLNQVIVILRLFNA